MFLTSDSQKTVFQKKKRVGRGNGSRRGKNSGLGHKGQVKRAGKMPVFFEGGRKSLVRRAPKYKGFKALENKQMVSLPSSRVFEVIKDTLDLNSLVEAGLISKNVKNVRIYKTSEETVKVKFEENDSIHLTKGVQTLIKN